MPGKEIASLKQSIQALQNKVRQTGDNLNETISSLCAQDSESSAFVVTLAKLFLTIFGCPCSSDETIAILENTVLEHRTKRADSQHKIYRQKHQYETLYADGHVMDTGLNSVREKLSLASRRQTTHTEDIDYSLLGILNVGMPVIYGEGTRAVGRLLEHILTGSGDAAILAWTGTANDYNSCLPKDITVYDEVVPPHIPPLMETTEMDQRVTELHSSATDLSLSPTLYDRLAQLPPPTLISGRLRLPGIVSRVTKIVHASPPEPESQLHKLRAKSAIFGDMEITTKSNLIAMKRLYVVHPWGRVLLDQEFSDDVTDLAEVDEAVQALRILARLRQPFGALLFEQVSRTEYKRVAADSLIMTRIRDDVPLSDLIGSIRIIDVQ